MKYQDGMDLICIKTLKQSFIKGKSYKIEKIFQNYFNTIFLQIINELGELQQIDGGDKTKYFKIPRPEGIPVTPPPAPKTKEQKMADRKAKKELEKQQTEEWKKVLKLKVKDRNKRIIKKVFDFYST